MKWLPRRRPSPALIISLIALFVALGGTGYAAVHLGKNTVGTRQLKKNAVTSAKVKNGSLTGADIRAGSISGSSINLGALGTVPSATNAVNAANAVNAGTAAVANSIGAVIYVAGNSVTAPASTGSLPYDESDQSKATCPAGTVVIGTGSVSGAAGVEVSEESIISSTTTGAPDTVRVYFDNFNPTDVDGNFAEAVCAAANSVNNQIPGPMAPAKKSAGR
ncbi:MAG TPA: hypothetical protein VJU60_11460 [Thermoleophilaceae bacterium]|nr:hypothetical protein [Thermoleophilaceae bacterium]